MVLVGRIWLFRIRSDTTSFLITPRSPLSSLVMTVVVVTWVLLSSFLMTRSLRGGYSDTKVIFKGIDPKDSPIESFWTTCIDRFNPLDSKKNQEPSGQV